MRHLVLIAAVLLVACTAPPPRPVLPETFHGTAAPSDAERAEVLRLTHLYWRALAKGRMAEAYDMLTLDHRARLPITEFRSGSSPVSAGQPTVTSIRWEQGLHRFQGPELFAVVAWSARSGGRGVFGRLIWRREPDDTFRISAIE